MHIIVGQKRREILLPNATSSMKVQWRAYPPPCAWISGRNLEMGSRFTGILIVIVIITIIITIIKNPKRATILVHRITNLKRRASTMHATTCFSRHIKAYRVMGTNLIWGKGRLERLVKATQGHE